MPGSADLDLALRINADMNAAVDALRRVQDEVRKTGSAGTAAGGGLRNLATASDAGAAAATRLGKELDASRKSMDASTRSAQKLGKSIGLMVTAATAAFGLLLKSTVAFDSQIGDMSQRLGASTETLSALGAVARKNGADLNAVQLGFVNLARAAANGASQAGRALTAMGIPLAQFQQLTATQQFDLVARKFASYTDGANKAALATALFGQRGVALIPTLNQVGNEGLQAVTDKAIAAGTAIGGNAVAAANAFANSLADLRTKLQGAANDLLVQFRPQIDSFARTINSPEFQTNLKNAAEGVAAIGEAAIRAAGMLGDGLTALKNYAEYAAKMQHGAGGDDLTGLRLEQGDIQAELQQRKQHPILSGVNSFLSGTENNVVNNALEGGRPRIQSMSTKDLQTRLAQIDAAILHASTTAPDAKNPQEGDNRGLFVGLSSQAPTVASTTRTSRTPIDRSAQQAAQLAARAQDQLTQSLITMQGALDPATSAWAKYNSAVSAAQAQEAAILAVHPEQKAALDAQVAAVEQLAASQRDATLAEQQRAAMEKQLSALQTETQGILSEGSRQEQMIQAEQQAGLITEYTARQRLLAIHGQMADALDDELQKWRAFAEATGDTTALANIQALSDQITQLRMNVNDVQLAFRSGFEGGLEQALEGLATRAMTVGQAFRAMAQAIVQSMAQAAARALAAKATDAISSLFGGGPAGGAAGSAQLTAAGGAVAAGGVAVSAGATALAASAVALQGAATTLMIANSTGFGLGFASGGFTGFGGVHEVAGVVHKGEGVLSQPEIAALGGPAGFYTLRAAISRGYADGGFVNPLANAPSPADLGFHAPARSRADLSQLGTGSGGGRSAPQVGVRIINSVDPQFVTDNMASPSGETVIVNTIARNRARIKQMIG